jgi:hypothetical protein
VLPNATLADNLKVYERVTESFEEEKTKSMALLWAPKIMGSAQLKFQGNVAIQLSPPERLDADAASPVSYYWGNPDASGL